MASKVSGDTMGGVQGTSAEVYNKELGITIDSVKHAIMSYSPIDMWNRATVYHMGFNDQATSLIEDLAKGDYGLATTIAKQAVERQGWTQYGARFSEKQAYVMAKAAYDNKLISEKSYYGVGIFRDNSKEAAEMDARQRAARSARRQRRKERDERIKAVAESNKGYNIGSIVKEPRTGREGKVVSMTNDIVEVDYGEGVRRKYARNYARFL